MLRPFRFLDPTNRVGFKLCVFAKTEAAARQYVKNQAMSSLTHRRLRFVGEGHPTDQKSWCGATVRDA